MDFIASKNLIPFILLVNSKRFREHYNPNKSYGDKPWESVRLKAGKLSGKIGKRAGTMKIAQPQWRENRQPASHSCVQGGIDTEN